MSEMNSSYIREGPQLCSFERVPISVELPIRGDDLNSASPTESGEENGRYVILKLRPMIGSSWRCIRSTIIEHTVTAIASANNSP